MPATGADAETLTDLSPDQRRLLEQVLSLTQEDKKSALDALSSVGGVEGVCRLLSVPSLKSGLPSSFVPSSAKLFGANFTPSPPPESFLSLFADALTGDTTVQILLAAALVSLLVGVYEKPSTGWIEGVAIFAAVVIVALVTSTNDYNKERQFRKLDKVAADSQKVKVRRDGKVEEVSPSSVVAGDVVLLAAGDSIPADGVLAQMDGDSLEVNESSITGEADDVRKTVGTMPFMLSGCTVTDGSGAMVVTAVGKYSRWGKIKSELSNEQPPTPLQEKLDGMAALIGYVGMAAAAATFVATLSMRYFRVPQGEGGVDLEGWFDAVLRAFIMSVTIVVVAVPEGLPLAVTISLAFSTQKMLKDNNLIRFLFACETMGNCTSICSDKTGTLTENKMTVVDGIVASVSLDKAQGISTHAARTIYDCISYCSSAIIGPNNSIIGNKTEGALLLYISGESGSGGKAPWGGRPGPVAVREEAGFGAVGGGKVFPFSSTKKTMSVLINLDRSGASSEGAGGGKRGSTPPPTTTKRRHSGRSPARNAEGSWRLYHKGAAEKVLEACSHYVKADGSVELLTKEVRAHLEDRVLSFSRRSLRPIALAHRDNCQSDVPDIVACSAADCEKLSSSNLVLEAIFAIADPIRKEVPEAVRQCKSAGITVRMVTGDNVETAKAIAIEAGILTEGSDDRVIEGADFRKLTPRQLDELLPRIKVLARLTPQDKLMLVQRLNGSTLPKDEDEWRAIHPFGNYNLQKDELLPGMRQEWEESAGRGGGEVVGVTGDGTNDAPALRAADVGLSMGMCGTDVAKAASDIVILDDNFNSIVKAVLWGRSVYDNIRKFLQFQLTVNVVALTITFVSSVGGYNPPLNAIMMLWVNLIMDTMGALALGTEPPEDSLLQRRPYKREAMLISRPMWRNIFCQAAYQLFLLLWMLKEGPGFFNEGAEGSIVSGDKKHFTLIFNAFVCCQIFNEFNAREIGDDFRPLHRILRSPMFVAVIAATIFGQYLIVTYGGDFTSTVPLSAEEWRITVLMGSFSIVVGFFMRLIPVSEDEATFAGVQMPGTVQLQKQRLSDKIVRLALFVIPALGLYAYATVASQGEAFSFGRATEVILILARRFYSGKGTGQAGEL